MPFIGEHDMARLTGFAVPHSRDTGVRVEIGRAQCGQLGISASREQRATHKIAKRRLAGIHEADAFRFRQIAYARDVYRFERCDSPPGIVSRDMAGLPCVVQCGFG